MVGGECGDAERGLGDAGVGDASGLGLASGLVEDGGREESRRGGLVEAQEALEFRKRDEQVGEHAGALAALPGEEEGHFADVGAVREIDAVFGGVLAVSRRGAAR